MKRWLQEMLYKFSNWMYGRYGTDELTLFLLITSLALAFLSCLPFLWMFSPVATVLIIWSCFRSFSKNITKRRKELDVTIG